MEEPTAPPPTMTTSKESDDDPAVELEEWERPVCLYCTCGWVSVLLASARTSLLKLNLTRQISALHTYLAACSRRLRILIAGGAAGASILVVARMLQPSPCWLFFFVVLGVECQSSQCSAVKHVGMASATSEPLRQRSKRGR